MVPKTGLVGGVGVPDMRGSGEAGGERVGRRHGQKVRGPREDLLMGAGFSGLCHLVFVSWLGKGPWTPVSFPQAAPTRSQHLQAQSHGAMSLGSLTGCYPGKGLQPQAPGASLASQGGPTPAGRVPSPAALLWGFSPARPSRQQPPALLAWAVGPLTWQAHSPGVILQRYPLDHGSGVRGAGRPRGVIPKPVRGAGPS